MTDEHTLSAFVQELRSERDRYKAERDRLREALQLARDDLVRIGHGRSKEIVEQVDAALAGDDTP